MGLASMLLSDPGALPYLVIVKASSQAALLFSPCSVTLTRSPQKWDLDAKKLPKDPSLRFCYGVRAPHSQPWRMPHLAEHHAVACLPQTC